MDALTLHVNDWDDEGTLYHLSGRGPVLASYCVQTIRRAIVARLTPLELIELGYGNPEHFVARVVAKHPVESCGDCDATDTTNEYAVPFVQAA